MEIFLVGGAVRDFLLARLNRSFKSPAEEQTYWERVEKDWVVVGSTPEEMISLGYRPVGKSFPVFLHPNTQDEFALARTERKTGKGYTGFECYTGLNVTLEEDLKRRDLTINAIAAPCDFRHITFETIIDPYHGLDDLKNKIFRHVSEAFSEDPVRILRIARLACRFDEFSVHTSTNNLMLKMVADGEVDSLVPERVWQEWSRSLNEKAPWRWFEILENCQAITTLFPAVKLNAQKKKALATAVNQEAPLGVRLALELFDVGYETLCELFLKYRIPNDFKDLALIVAKYFPLYLQISYDPLEILDLFEKTDAFRRHDRFEQFLMTCHYLQLAKSKDEPNQRKKLQNIYTELLAIDHSMLIKKGFIGKEIAQEIRRIRILKIAELMSAPKK